MAAGGGLIRGLPAGFLAASSHSDANRATPAPRRGCRIEPLLDACDTYAALEAAWIAAQTSIWIAHWSFDPDFPTQSTAAQAAHIDTWSALLTDAVERGVSVRVLINDFDPVVEYSWHLQAWQAYRHLLEVADAATAHSTSFDRARFQVVVSMHPAELTGPLVDLLSVWTLNGAVGDLNEWAANHGIESAARAFDLLPGLWGLAAFDPAATRPFKTLGKGPQRPVHMASHHQKLCVVDGRVAFLGGIDIGPDLISNGRHDANPFRHDVHLRVTGPVVNDLAALFRSRWNTEAPKARATIGEYNTRAPGVPLPLPHVDAIPALVASTERPGTTIAQVIHTSTGEVRDPPVPDPRRLDTEASVKAALQGAEQFVYIENQYVRWPVLADWLLTARSKRKGLSVIVVVPFTPEEAVNAADTDAVTLHGMHLQHVTLTRLAEKFGSRAGIFTLTSRVAATAAPKVLQRCGHRANATSHATPTLARSPSVYVHSKVLIVDDWFALVGSANLDGRAFRVDTEVGIAWHHPAEIKRFRLGLWSEHLGPDIDLPRLLPHEYVSTWSQRALRHAVTDPKTRPGLVVPYPLATAPKGSESLLDPRLMNIMARGAGDETAGYHGAGLQHLRPRRRAAIT
jgi:phosphatidylserine/phosphatidylglycerophosphate/cardiolipin synthase-like enzyme